MRRRDMLMGAAAAGLLPARAAVARAATIAFPMDMPDWDPMVNNTPTTASIVKCVFDSPMDLSPNLKLIPNVVSGYRWLDKAGLVFQLDLRGDVTFHNGDRLTSEDVKFTLFDRVKADPTVLSGAPWRSVTAVETPSPTRAILHFAKPWCWRAGAGGVRHRGAAGALLPAGRTEWFPQGADRQRALPAGGICAQLAHCAGGL